MIVFILAHHLARLASSLKVHWDEAIVPAVIIPAPVWNDFSDLSAVSVVQFPIHEHFGHKDLLPYVVDVNVNGVEKLNALADKLEEISAAVRQAQDSPVEMKWAVLQMTSEQVDILRTIAAGRKPQPRPGSDSLTPYN